MSARVHPATSPPFGVVAPFFFAAPAGLVAGGLLLATASPEVFVGINDQRTVAVTHAIVLGWITTTLMGAVYQLGPAVFGGALLSLRLVRVQQVTHVVAVPVFVWALLEWRTTMMGVAGSLLLVSFILFGVNAVASLLPGPRSLPRAYLLASLAMLALTAALGITWVGALQHGWFGITPGKLAAHAFLGLAGWLGIALMGVSYQLVPMFNVVNRAKPRLGWVVLPVSAGAVLVFAALMYTDPGPNTRLLLAALLALGPLTWAVDQLRLMAARSRRKLDVQGKAVFASLAFLAVAVVTGLAAAHGTPGTTDDEPARWLLAFAAVAVLGWIGLNVIGNTYKILPFLIWFHRYRSLVGIRPVPVMTDIYHERTATTVLLLLATAAVLLFAAALMGDIRIFRTGGVLLAGCGLLHEGALLHMLLPKSSSRTLPSGRAALP